MFERLDVLYKDLPRKQKKQKKQNNATSYINLLLWLSDMGFFHDDMQRETLKIIQKTITKKHKDISITVFFFKEIK